MPKGASERRAGSENRARRTRAETRRENERQDEGKSNEMGDGARGLYTYTRTRMVLVPSEDGTSR